MISRRLLRDLAPDAFVAVAMLCAVAFMIWKMYESIR